MHVKSYPQLVFAFLALGLFLACGGVTGDTPEIPSAPGTVAPGAGADLLSVARAALACSSGTIAFSVQEAAGGSVTASGLYTAPACGPSFAAGTYHVIASGCSNTVTIPLTVSEAVTSLAIVCAIPAGATACQDPSLGVTASPGGATQLYAKLVMTCHSVFSPVIPAGACSAAFCQ